MLYEVALSLIEGVGSVTAKQLISYCGSAEAVFKTNESKLLKIPQVGNFVARMILKKDTLADAEKEIIQAEKQGIKLLFFTDAAYPLRLKNLHDSPILIYYKGKAEFNNPKSIAIVGTREASEYGKQATEYILEQLKSYKPLVVSGLAYGIDITAHRASLKNNLETIGVMASGLDVIYPASHKKTAMQMIEENGGLLTESRLGTKPDAMRFPARNRIIAGLADAIIVVEAKSKGGALITADIANSYNKDVFAVPGNIFSTTSAGCNQLIQSHQAHLLKEVQDIALLLNWNTPNQSVLPKQQKLNFENFELNDKERIILDLLKDAQDKTMFLDEIGWKSGLSASVISACLLNLELIGLVKTMPGKKFTLIH